jgi:hypothetical protein
MHRVGLGGIDALPIFAARFLENKQTQNTWKK